MDTIIGAVTALWEFLVFPAVLVCVVSVTLHAVLRPGPGWSARAAERLQLSRLLDAHVHDRLEKFGLAKVVPIAAAFLFIFILNATRSVADAAGGLLPGHVTYDPGALILHVADPEQLSILWQRRPLLNRPDQLGTQLAEVASMIRTRDSTSLGAGSLQWRRQLGTNAARLDAVKFVMFVALLAYAAKVRVRDERPRRTRNLLIVLVVGLVVCVYLVTQEVYAIEQAGFADYRAVWTSTLETDTLTRTPRADQVAAVHDFREREPARWWSFRWADESYPRWLYRTFVAPEPYYPRRPRD